MVKQIRSFLFLVTIGVLQISLTTETIAQTALPLPSHSSVYSGSARGYWFIAPSDFIISGLRVPFEAGTGPQYIHLVKLDPNFWNPAVPPPFTAQTSNFTTLTYINGTANMTINQVNIPIKAGEIIGVLGTANTGNSYATGSFASNINGLPVTLSRFGYQGNINGSQAPQVWGVAQGAAGSITRVEMWWKPAAVGLDNAEMVSIDRPSNCEGENDVVVTVKNAGLNQITSVNIDWEINGILQTPVTYSNVLDTFNGNFPREASVTLGSVTLLNGVPTTITAWTSMPNGVVDTIRDNDTASKTIDPLPTISSFPYYETFEGGQGPWYIDGLNPSWAFGTPAKNTIVGTSTGANAFVTGGLGTAPHNNDEASNVNSPCFDFSNFTGTPWVAMDVWWNVELGWDGAALQTSVDGGATWQTVGIQDDPYNWYTDSTLDAQPGGQSHGWSGRASEGNTGSAGYVNAKHALPEDLIGNIVRFRVAFGADAATQDDGFAFDDFRIVDYKEADLGSDRHSMCQSPNATLDPNLNLNGSVLWSTSATAPTIQVTTTGQYWVEYTDTLIDLVSSDTVEVIQSPPLVVNWSPYEDTIYLDGYTTLNPNLPLNVDYNWMPGNHTFPYFVVRPQDHGPGTHTFTLNAVDSVRCSAQDQLTVHIVNQNGIGELAGGVVEIFPNPVNDVLKIRTEGIDGAIQLRLTDLNGRLLRQSRIASDFNQQTELNLSDLAPGTYLLQLVRGNEIVVQKFIKE